MLRVHRPAGCACRRRTCFRVFLPLRARIKRSIGCCALVDWGRLRARRRSGARSGCDAGAFAPACVVGVRRWSVRTSMRGRGATPECSYQRGCRWRASAQTPRNAQAMLYECASHACAFSRSKPCLPSPDIAPPSPARDSARLWLERDGTCSGRAPGARRGCGLQGVKRPGSLWLQVACRGGPRDGPDDTPWDDGGERARLATTGLHLEAYGPWRDGGERARFAGVGGFVGRARVGVVTDKAYDSRALRRMLSARGVLASIMSRARGGFGQRPRLACVGNGFLPRRSVASVIPWRVVVLW
jgi:hypothetical protein